MFATAVRPDLQGRSLHQAFVDDELSKHPSLRSHLPGYVTITTRTTRGTIKPQLRGASTEGAIYGALFLDLANRISLAHVVNLYLRCGASDVGGFLAYADKQRRGKYRADVAEVAATWRLR